jgi:hypothetical protein
MYTEHLFERRPDGELWQDGTLHQGTTIPQYSVVLLTDGTYPFAVGTDCLAGVLQVSSLLLHLVAHLGVRAEVVREVREADGSWSALDHERWAQAHREEEML